MKTYKNVLILMLTVMVLSCASSKNSKNKLPLELGDVYYQESIEDETKGNTEITIFIPVVSNANDLKLDTVYFRGQQTALKLVNNVFVGQFESLAYYKQDIIMSNAPFAEYGNKVPVIDSKRTSGLGKFEALVSYNVEDKMHYFKISNIIKKEL